MSKDGFETLVSRTQSKRNLSNFLDQYMKIETANMSDNEIFWWHTQTIKAEEDLKGRIQKFIENHEVHQHNESFAYEGIFDKKNAKHAVPYIKFEKSRMESSQYMTPAATCKYSFLYFDKTLKLILMPF